jgi:hypothetical protein
MLMLTELELPGANYYMLGTDVETWFGIIREASVLAATQYVSPWRHLQMWSTVFLRFN